MLIISTKDKIIVRISSKRLNLHIKSYSHSDFIIYLISKQKNIKSKFFFKTI